jgi:predicted MFS family arabinose efflux permease
MHPLYWNAMTPPPAARGLTGLRVLALTTLQQAGLTSIRFGLPILAPFWRDDFHLSLGQVGLLLGAFDLGSFLLFIPIGLLTDRWGERRVLLAGALSTAFAAASVTQARSLASLALLIAIAGLGYGSGQTAGVKAVAAAFGAGGRGMAMGVRQSGLPLGGLIAALLMPPLSAAFGWRAALAAAAVVCALPGVLCWIGLREAQAAPGRPHLEPAGRSTGAHLRRIVQNCGVRRTTEAAMLLVFVQMCYQGYLALYFVDRFGWSNHAATTLLVGVHLGGVLGRLAWGAVSDRRYGGRRVPALAWCVSAGTVFPLALVLLPASMARPLTAGAVALAGGMLLLGWNGLYSTLVAESLRSGGAATAMGMSMTGLYATSMLAPPLFGWLVDHSSYRAAWAALVLVMAGALLVSVRVPEPRARPARGCAA